MLYVINALAGLNGLAWTQVISEGVTLALALCRKQKRMHHDKTVCSYFKFIITSESYINLGSMQDTA